MQVCGLQIDAGEVRFSQVDAGEVRPGAAFSARFHPLLVLIQNFCKIDQRNSDGAFAAGNLFHRRRCFFCGGIDGNFRF